MLQSIERYMKQAIVDKSPSVSSAGLVSSLHLMASSGEIIRRWVNEAQEAANSDKYVICAIPIKPTYLNMFWILLSSPMYSMLVQYHAIGLLYAVRKTDRLAVIKLVSKYTSLAVRSPFATCMLIRIACRLMEEDPDNDSTYQDFLESCLRHKSEMVIYEAAHAIVNLKRTGARELSPAVSVLQLFCSSPKATLRFAAVRTLNKVWLVLCVLAVLVQVKLVCYRWLAPDVWYGNLLQDSFKYCWSLSQLCGYDWMNVMGCPYVTVPSLEYYFSGG